MNSTMGIFLGEGMGRDKSRLGTTFQPCILNILGIRVLERYNILATGRNALFDPSTIEGGAQACGVGRVQARVHISDHDRQACAGRQRLEGVLEADHARRLGGVLGEDQGHGGGCEECESLEELHGLYIGLMWDEGIEKSTGEGLRRCLVGIWRWIDRG